MTILFVSVSILVSVVFVILEELLFGKGRKEKKWELLKREVQSGKF